MRASALVTALIFFPYYMLAIEAFVKGEGLGGQQSFVRTYAYMYGYGTPIFVHSIL